MVPSIYMVALFFNVDECFACMYVLLYVLGSMEIRRGIRFFRSRVMDSCELRIEPVILSAKPSHQLLLKRVFMVFKYSQTLSTV